MPGLLLILVVTYLLMNKRRNSDEQKQIRELRKGTKTNNFSSEILYQKAYLIYSKIPGIKRYLLKLRRRLEIINIEDEYKTRRQASSIITKSLFVIIPLTILIIALAHTNKLLLRNITNI